MGAKTCSTCSAVSVSTVAVGERPGAVDDGTQRVLGGNRAEQPFERLAVRYVTGGDPSLRTQLFELALQLLRPLGFLAAAADQEQVASAVTFGEVASDECAEAAGSAGDQDGALGVDRQRRPPPPAPRVPWSERSRRQRHALAQGELGLLGSQGQRRRKRRLRGLAAVGVDQGEAAGVLGLGRAHEAPDRRGGGLGTSSRSSPSRPA